MAETNMYGCKPCAKCGSKYCYRLKDGTVVCDDCGHKQSEGDDD